MPPRSRARDDVGQVTVLIIGFTAVLLVATAVVTDASAGYLRRQELSTLADGAALFAADAGVRGDPIYTEGVGDEPLAQSREQARAGVVTYLNQVGAYAAHPGLRVNVRVEGPRVLVDLDAPLELPIPAPGAPDSARVGASGSAITDPE